MEGLNQFELEKDGNKWTGQELETKSDPVIDPGSGGKVVIRKFDYSWNPMIKEKPSKQEVFNFHAKEIRNFLWRDGLSILENQDPRVVYNEKDNTYSFFVVCGALGAILETPRNLTEILK